MNDRSRGGFWATAVAVLGYGAAMGYLEAAVLVHLRGTVGFPRRESAGSMTRRPIAATTMALAGPS
jgi:hypothetical protein